MALLYLASASALQGANSYNNVELSGCFIVQIILKDDRRVPDFGLIYLHLPPDRVLAIT